MLVCRPYRSTCQVQCIPHLLSLFVQAFIQCMSCCNWDCYQASIINCSEFVPLVSTFQIMVTQICQLSDQHVMHNAYVISTYELSFIDCYLAITLVTQGRHELFWNTIAFVFTCGMMVAHNLLVCRHLRSTCQVPCIRCLPATSTWAATQCMSSCYYTRQTSCIVLKPHSLCVHMLNDGNSSLQAIC